MKISGSSVLHASPDRVWAAITDPAVLSAVIPGCDVLTPIGGEHVRADRDPGRGLDQGLLHR